MLFPMLHGIVILSLIQAVKYTVLYFCLFVRFLNTFLLQIKEFNVVIHIIAGWLGSWHFLTSFFKINGKKILLEPTPLKKLIFFFFSIGGH